MKPGMINPTCMAPSMTTSRISISADIVVTLKDSGGHETLMPPVERWKKF